MSSSNAAVWEDRFRAIFDGAHDGIVLADDGGVYVDANPAACRILGRSREELLGTSIPEVSAQPAEEVRAHWRRFLEAGSDAGKYTLERPDGSTVEVEFSAAANVLPGLHLSVLRDLTDRRQLEEQLLQTEKLEALAQVSGGIAQDFNNLLTSILGSAELAEARIGEGEEPHTELASIREMVDRGARLVEHLLAFSRRQEHRPEPLALAEAVDSVQLRVAHLLGDAIELTVAVPAALPAVLVDRAYLEQALVNLVANAVAAMPAGGALQIAARALPAGQAGPDAGPAPAAGWVELTVSDTGAGMPADVRDRAFEPFFTTKSPEAASGLGLSSVYGIAQASGGAVTLESAPGEGTRVRLLLPASDEVAVAAAGEPEASAARAPQQARVLLVEDEATIRRLIATALERAGHTVQAFESAEEAAARFAEDTAAVDLLIADVVLPGASGADLLQRVRTDRPDLPVLLMSGYTAEHVAAVDVDEPGTAFLPKPFGLRELVEQVDRLLAAGRDGG